jgi:hypothetical protein
MLAVFFLVVKCLFKKPNLVLFKTSGGFNENHLCFLLKPPVVFIKTSGGFVNLAVCGFTEGNFK